jgi:hypothetical protein
VNLLNSKIENKIREKVHNERIKKAIEDIEGYDGSYNPILK